MLACVLTTRSTLYKKKNLSNYLEVSDYLLIFAGRKVFNCYERRNQEPTGAAAMIDYSETALMESDFHDFPLGKCGFYTNDPVELEQRVAMIEADLDEVDAGIDDPQKWIQVDDFMVAMRKEHPWL